MGRVVATVLKVNGTAFVRSEDGSLRALKPGDKVYEGEVLVTWEGGSAELEIVDGSIIPVDENREIRMIGQLVDQPRESREAEQVDDTYREDPFLDKDSEKTEENTQYPHTQHGYIRVEKSEAPPDSPDYHFVSVVGSYKPFLGVRSGYGDPFMEGRATHDPRIEFSLAPLDRQEREEVVRVFREFEESERRIPDTQPEIDIPEDALVDEDDLVPDGSDQSEEPVGGGSLALIPGDEAFDTFFEGNTPPVGLTSAGQEVKYYVSPDGHTLIGYTGDLLPNGIPDEDQQVFKVVINNPDSQAGEQSYTYTQLDQLDHFDADGENQLVLTFNFTAKDIDGDSVSSSFNVGVVDDVPTANPDEDEVTEDSGPAATGNVVEGGAPVLEDDELGADNDPVSPVTGVEASGTYGGGHVSGNV
ncbi:MAG: retention module-containing protein, partial [Chlorobiales bacterium]|nr:retention module-containing protein [Chlorobiales bacterium]